MLRTLDIAGKAITIRTAGVGGPVIYLHVFQGDGNAEWSRCLELGCDNFTLVSIGNLNWADDMTPWECPAIFKGTDPYKGEAKQQLDLLVQQIKPAIESALPHTPTFSALAGYSLAGLFATWSAFNTDAFTRIASASGSLWYPDFVGYARQHVEGLQVSHAYFSLGDKEKKTRNELMRAVEDDTKSVASAFSAQANTLFQLNKGNHFSDADLRTAKAIAWLLDSE